MSTHFMASFAAGLVGAVFSTPIDVVKVILLEVTAAFFNHHPLSFSRQGPHNV